MTSANSRHGWRTWRSVTLTMARRRLRPGLPMLLITLLCLAFSRDSFGAAPQRFELDLSLTEVSFRTGYGAGRAYIAFRNFSLEDVVINKAFNSSAALNLMKLDVRVTGPSGRVLSPRLELGRQIGPLVEGQFIKIPKGLTWEVPIYLGEMFDLSEVGEYTVTVGYENRYGEREVLSRGV